MDNDIYERQTYFEILAYFHVYRLWDLFIHYPIAQPNIVFIEAIYYQFIYSKINLSTCIPMLIKWAKAVKFCRQSWFYDFVECKENIINIVILSNHLWKLSVYPNTIWVV